MIINILEYFKKTVKNHADEIAVIDGEVRLTFAELYARGVTGGGLISRETGGATAQPVAVLLRKSAGCIIADTAILFSGNAYMNLDVKAPVSRLAAIMDRIRPIALITDKAGTETVKALGTVSGIRIIMVKELMGEEAMDDADTFCSSDNAPDAHGASDADGAAGISDAEKRAGYHRLIDTDPLCVINTSGSTGVPKGVALNHRSFIDFWEWASISEKLIGKEIIGSLSPIVFDHFSFELCIVMCSASTMVIIPDGLAAFPARMLQLISECRVTYIFWVPTIMVNIANMGLLGKFDLASLKMIWFAGEVFPTKQFNVWRRGLPDAEFVNLYGPTEITVDCTFFRVDRDIPDDEPIPIGFPCRNTDIIILNENNSPVAKSEEGELCVRGTSLALGYYNDPEKTAAAFVQNPLNDHYPELIYRTGDIVTVNDNGEIIFKGRRDTLIKHAGYRIELSEVEHVIVNTAGIVKNGCAVYDAQNKEIVFFYESDEGSEGISTAEFRRSLSPLLPKYMIPAVYIKIDELPRNTNGKIDRLKLKESLQESGK